MESPRFEQCEWFGGEFTPEYGGRYSLGPSVRCWSAYMLFYEREDFQENYSVSDICRTMQSVLLCTFYLLLPFLFPFTAICLPVCE